MFCLLFLGLDSTFNSLYLGKRRKQFEIPGMKCLLPHVLDMFMNFFHSSI